MLRCLFSCLLNLTIALSGLLWYIATDYPFCIFKPFSEVSLTVSSNCTLTGTRRIIVVSRNNCISRYFHYKISTYLGKLPDQSYYIHFVYIYTFEMEGPISNIHFLNQTKTFAFVDILRYSQTCYHCFSLPSNRTGSKLKITVT